METEFQEFFNGRVKERGYSIKQLSEISGITRKYLEAISSGSFGNLPSSPYFRGYLQRLGEILGFDWEPWWSRFKDSSLIRDSAVVDLPPKNRFLTQRINKNWWVVAIVVIIVVYLAIQATRIFGQPIIKITNPPENPAASIDKEVTISGIVENGSELSINGEFVEIGSGGTWQKNVLLQPGINSFEVTAKKFLGSESKVIEQILYEPTSTTWDD